MVACPEARRCALHEITVKEALRVWESFYCDGCYTRCERYKLALSGVAVPPRLLPNGRILDVPDFALAKTGS